MRGWRLRPLDTLSGVLLTALRAGSTRAQKPDPCAPLRELAERLLMPVLFGVPPSSVRLYPRTLPPGLPLTLPLPPDSRLVGSVVRPSLAPGPEAAPCGEAFDIVLDVPGHADTVLTFYRRALADLGWTSPPARGPGLESGFLPSTAPTLGAAFCAGAERPWLTVSVSPRADASNDVRVHIETGTPGPCGGPSAPPLSPPLLLALPALHAPAGVRVLPLGGSADDVHAESRAVVQTDTSVADIEAHYARQLAAAGWTRLDGTAQGRLAWSVWRVPGEGEWEGLLYVLDGPGAGRRSLHVQVATPRAEAVPFK